MRFLCGVSSIFIALFLTVQGNAQTLGNIKGEVRDAAGVAVPNAKVTLTNVDTGAARAVQTNADGIVSFPSLIPGMYSVKVEAAGFMTEIRSNVELQVQGDIRLDFKLQAGQGTETTAAGTAQLDTEDTTGGSVIENRRVVDLPLNGRDYMQEIALSPTATNMSANTQAGASGTAVGNGGAVTNQGGSRGSEFYGIAGQRTDANLYTIDGLSNTDVNYNLYVLLPSIDAIKEFKIQSGIYPAEFGRELGQVNVSTISGGNRYHGVLFEFLRNDKTDAVTFQFTPVAPVFPPFKWNQYGFTLDGPLSIPKVFNARNKLFFMVNFEGFNQRGLTNTVYNVPTPAMRGGDLSGGLTSAGGTGLLYQPFGRVQNADGSITATPVPGNIIPASQITPDSLIMMTYLPFPNQPVSGSSKDYLGAPSTPVNKYQFTSRLDYTESAKSTWFARFSWTGEDQSTPTLLPTTGAAVLTNAKQYQVSNTRVISATKVNEARFGISVFHNSLTQFVSSVDYTKLLGLPGLLSDAFSTTWGIPLNKGVGGGLSNWGDPTNGPYILNDATFQGNDNFSWTHGKHSFRFGGELRRDRFNQFGQANPRGAFYDAGYDSSNPNNPQSNQYTGWGSFLLGAPSEVQGAVTMSFVQMRATSGALYVDDTWHVSRRVTLSLGLRWEDEQPWLDKSGHEVNAQVPYYPGVHDGSFNIANMALHPVLVRAGTGGFYDGTGINYPGVQVARDGRLGDRLVPSDPHNFAPRIGLAWSPSPKWAVRVGTGLFYTVASNAQFFGMASAVSGSYTTLNSNTLPSFTWTNWITPGSTLQVVQPALTAMQMNVRTPRVYQWMADVQRQLSPSTILVASYSGTVGRFFQDAININQPLASAIGSVTSRMPFPEFQSLSLTNSDANADYNAFATRLQRRAHGITFQASYTWSHALDYSGAENVRCISCDHASSNFDVKERFVTSAVYDLPFGKGEKFANTGGVVNQIVGGWQLSLIYNLMTGVPILIQDNVDQANVGNSTSRPNATGLSPHLANPGPNEWFNTAAFVVQPFGTFGNEGRDNVRNPGRNNGDVIMARNFKIREGHSLQFRYEAYNFLNHPNWGSPTIFANQATFAQIVSTAIPMRQMQFSLKYRF